MDASDPAYRALATDGAFPKEAPILTIPCLLTNQKLTYRGMLLTPLDNLTWAYQLHYYLCFRTYRRQEFFRSQSSIVALTETMHEICERHDYHLLNCKAYPDNFRCLLSLRPSQAISRIVQTLKANSSRILRPAEQLWARGFLARSVGKVRVKPVRKYLEQQAEHHGYASRILPPVFRYRSTATQKLYSAHSAFELNHHLVIATRYRLDMFTSAVAEQLSCYWLKVAAAREFAIDQISVVPEHVHLLIRAVPRMSIEQCALLLLNNGQHFIGKTFPHLLVTAGADQLWQGSAYAGTCGEISTALMKHWLNSPVGQ